MAAFAQTETVQTSSVEKEIIFHVYESANRFFMPKRWNWIPLSLTNGGTGSEDYQNSSTRPSMDFGNDTGEESCAFNSATSKITTFKVYVSNCERTSIKFDLMQEANGSGQNKMYDGID